jgi:hypothetical protein
MGHLAPGVVGVSAGLRRVVSGCLSQVGDSSETPGVLLELAQRNAAAGAEIPGHQGRRVTLQASTRERGVENIC